MRTILLLIFIYMGFASSAQISVVRAKINADYGLLKYTEIGATVQFNQYFTVGAYVNSITDKLYVKNSSNLSIINSLENRGESFMLCAGLASYAPEKIHFTGLAGISLGKFHVHENIALEPLPSGSLQVISDRVYKTLPGFSLRGEITFGLSEVFGLTCGAYGNVNPKFVYGRLYVGLSIGKLGTR